MGGGVAGGLGVDDNGPAEDTSIIGDILATMGIGSSFNAGIGSGIYSMNVDNMESMASLDAGNVLGEAWSRTSDRLGETRAMAADDPTWTQEVLNTVMDPPGVGGLQIFDMLLNPSQAFAGLSILLRKAGLGAGDASQIKTGILTMASGLEVIGQPLFDLLNNQIVSWKGQIGGFVDGIGDQLDNQRISLDAVRSGLAHIDEMMTVVGGLADEGGVIDTQVQGAFGFLNSLEAPKLQLPWWLQWLNAILVAPLNLAIAGARSGLEFMYNEARSGIDTQVDQIIEWIRHESKVLTTALQSGGEVEKTLDQAYDIVVLAAKDFAKTVNEWDPEAVSLSGAVDWLRATADKVPFAESAQERMHGWHGFVRTEGQGAVNSWKGKYSDEVRYTYLWHIQDYEMDAVQTIYDETKTALDDQCVEAKAISTDAHIAALTRRANLEISYTAAKTIAGMRNMPMKVQRIAMKSFWTAARDIGTAHHQLKNGAGRPSSSGSPSGLSLDRAEAPS